MKRTVKLIFLPALLITLMFVYGCPIALNFPPDEPGTVKIDKALLGTWICKQDSSCEVLTAKLEKLDDYSYNVEVLEKGEMYATEDVVFTGYVTKIDNLNILYLLEKSSGKYYNYVYEVSGKSLTIYDLSLLEGGVDAVTSTEALRAQIVASKYKEGFMAEPKQYRRN